VQVMPEKRWRGLATIPKAGRNAPLNPNRGAPGQSLPSLRAATCGIFPSLGFFTRQTLTYYAGIPIHCSFGPALHRIFCRNHDACINTKSIQEYRNGNLIDEKGSLKAKPLSTALSTEMQHGTNTCHVVLVLIAPLRLHLRYSHERIQGSRMTVQHNNSLPLLNFVKVRTTRQ